MFNDEMYQQKGGVDAHDSINMCPQFSVPNNDNDVDQVEGNDPKDLNQRVNSNGYPVAPNGRSSLPVACKWQVIDKHSSKHRFLQAKLSWKTKQYRILTQIRHG